MDVLKRTMSTYSEISKEANKHLHYSVRCPWEQSIEVNSSRAFKHFDKHLKDPRCKGVLKKNLIKFAKDAVETLHFL